MRHSLGNGRTRFSKEIWVKGYKDPCYFSGISRRHATSFFRRGIIFCSSSDTPHKLLVVVEYMTLERWCNLVFQLEHCWLFFHRGFGWSVQFSCNFLFNPLYLCWLFRPICWWFSLFFYLIFLSVVLFCKESSKHHATPSGPSNMEYRPGFRTLSFSL